MLATVVRDRERMPGGDELAALLAHRCGIHAHPRSIIRRLIPYLQRGGKKAPITAPAATLDVTQYAAQ